MDEYLLCEVCSEKKPIPQHCGKVMHLEMYQGKEMLICWMGSTCGVQELPYHHNQPMKIKHS
ncbi:MAG: hypothetical protein EAX86_06215 [Candidatus Heimdallarchaeota archaeon]|nr:hypothetical protein [Candidatus Heimdallarchaeota archaeon]